ncbi:MAG: hypothetical protein AAB473_00660 [Patescibacteria group bacterium]
MKRILGFWNTNKNNWGHLLWMGIVILILGGIIVGTGHTSWLIPTMICIETAQFEQGACDRFYDSGYRHPILARELEWVPLVAIAEILFSILACLFDIADGWTTGMIGSWMLIGVQIATSRFIDLLEHRETCLQRFPNAAFDESIQEGLMIVATLLALTGGTALLAQ